MRYGVLDLSGEALSLAVVEPTPDGRFHTVRHDTVRLPLTRHAAHTGLAPAGMVELALETLRRMVAVADRARCRRVRATLRADLVDSSVGATLAAEVGRLLREPATQLTHEDHARLRRRTVAGSRHDPHSDVDLTDAIILEAIASSSEDVLIAERAMAVAERLAAHGLAGDRHSDQVARLSGRLFDLLGRVHRLPPSDRELLHHGAQLHDVGRNLGPAARHRRGAEVVETMELPGYTRADMHAVASLVRFHKGRPPGSHYAPFTRLQAGMRDRVARLVTLLRLADGLDRGHDQSVVALRAEVEDALVVLDLGGDRLDLAIYGARSTAPMFEQVLGRRLVVRALSAVAQGGVAGMPRPSEPPVGGRPAHVQ